MGEIKHASATSHIGGKSARRELADVNRELADAIRELADVNRELADAIRELADVNRELAERKARLGKSKPRFLEEDLRHDIRRLMERRGMNVTSAIATLVRRRATAPSARPSKYPSVSTLWNAWKGR